MTYEISTDMISIVLNELIDKKSQRDGIKFTSSKLASALDLPRSSISRLIHPDRNKRLTNPTIGTLIKIVEFFKNDGINVSVNDFVGLNNERVIDVQEQEVGLLKYSITVPVYNLDGMLETEISTIAVNVDDNTNKFVAFVIKEDIKPIFKSGSIFIINESLIPQDDNLIGVKLEDKNQILIGKLHKNNDKMIVSLLDQKYTEKNICLISNYSIIGVVVQIIVEKK